MYDRSKITDHIKPFPFKTPYEYRVINVYVGDIHTLCTNKQYIHVHLHVHVHIHDTRIWMHTLFIAYVRYYFFCQHICTLNYGALWISYVTVLVKCRLDMVHLAISECTPTHTGH